MESRSKYLLMNECKSLALTLKQSKNVKIVFAILKFFSYVYHVSFVRGGGQNVEWYFIKNSKRIT
jgi:hypothetical protein